MCRVLVKLSSILMSCHEELFSPGILIWGGSPLCENYECTISGLYSHTDFMLCIIIDNEKWFPLSSFREKPVTCRRQLLSYYRLELVDHMTLMFCHTFNGGSHSLYYYGSYTFDDVTTSSPGAQICSLLPAVVVRRRFDS
jgi:hypothetical protein